MQKIVKVIVQKSLHLRRRKSPAQKCANKPHEPIHMFKSPGQAVAAVKIHAEAYALRPEDVHHMEDMITHVGDRRMLFICQKGNIEVYPCNTADLRKLAKLIVRQVAWMTA